MWDVFPWIWLITWSAFVLPLAIASLRGWAPRRVRSRTSPWGIRVRGVAMLVMWVGGLVPLLRWSGLLGQETSLLLTVVQAGLLMLAAGLISGSQLSELFRRRAVRSLRADQGPGGGRPSR
ncbi:hypothetical protein FBY22_3401 [Streptomyces sp. SLBN-31]|nr:hypothetical protein FBY22_3401 [Streptomyces sp. SLBN-31]